MDKAIIKEGDKVLMQIIIDGVVRKEFVSFCYKINGHLCVYSNGSMQTIDEMNGTNFIRLDSVKHKDIINKHTTHYHAKYLDLHNYKMVADWTLPWSFIRVRDELSKFRTSWNDKMMEYVKPWSKINQKKLA
jgi:hypothetical protein